MKDYKKTYVRSDDVMIDDYMKIAGYLYRVVNVRPFYKSIGIDLISVQGIRRYEITLQIPSNRLMKLWNQK